MKSIIRGSEKMSKRVLLVFPFCAFKSWTNERDVRSIPMGITYLASSLEKHDVVVDIIDLEVERLKNKLKAPRDFECEEANRLKNLFKQKIVDFKPDVVGINCLYSGLFPTVTFLASVVKNICSNIIVEIGGIHPTTFSREIISNYSNIIDYILKGESEETIVEFIKEICKAENNLDRIDGITYLKGNNIIDNPKREFINNLDSLPFPAVNKLNISDYYFDTSEYYNPKKIPIKTVVPIISSRSCPIGCNFCNMNLVHGKKIRYRSPENVVDEIQMYVENYDLHYFSFDDDNLTINKDRVIKIMNLIKKRNLNIQFSTDNGVYVNTLDEEVLEAMLDAGLVRLSLAFETGSDYIRNKVIGKGLYNKKIYELMDFFLNNKKFNKVFLYAFFVIGFPEETKQTLKETFELIKKFPLDRIFISYATPFPGTRLYEQCKKEKLFSKQCYYDLDNPETSKMLYYESEYPHIKPYKLELEEVINFKNEALNFMNKKIAASSVPKNHPLRYYK